MWPRTGENRHPRKTREPVAEGPDAEDTDAEIVDPDVDLHDPAQVAETHPRQWDILCAIALGGIIGAEGRYELG